MALRRTPSPKTEPVVWSSQAPAEAPTEIWVRVPGTGLDRRSRRWPMLLLGSFLVVLLAVAAAVAAAGFLLFYNSDRIMPGVEVLGAQLGGQTTAQAQATLQSHWQQRTVVLDAGGSTTAVSPQTLGITLDAEATAKAAYRQGRSLDSLVDIMRNGARAPVTPVWYIDLVAAQANLAALAPQLEVAPVNAGVQIIDGRAEVTPPVEGRTLDVVATVSWLSQNAAQALMDGRMAPVMAPVQPAVSDVSAVAEKANQLLTTSISVHAYDPLADETMTWTIAPETWSPWLVLEVDAAAPGQFNWSLRVEAAKAVLATQAEALGSERYLDLDEAVSAVTEAITHQNPNARVRAYHHPQQHLVQDGETLASIGRDYGLPYPWIQQANPGVDSLSVGQVLAIPSPDALIPLPVVENKRIVVSISQQRMWAYENGGLKWEWPVSTGIASSPTAPGVFQVQSHEPNAYAGNWDLWMPNFMGIYRPVPTSDFMNGFHGFPTRSGSQLLWTGDLGRPVTYGCILVSSDNAAQLYNWAEEGVIVEVQR